MLRKSFYYFTFLIPMIYTICNINCLETSKLETVERKYIEDFVWKYLPGMLSETLKHMHMSPRNLALNATKDQYIHTEVTTSTTTENTLENRMTNLHKPTMDNPYEVTINTIPDMTTKIQNSLETAFDKYRKLQNQKKNKYYSSEDMFIFHKPNDTSHSILPLLTDRIRRIIPKLAFKLKQIIPSRRFNMMDFSKNKVPFASTEFNGVSFLPQLNKYYSEKNVFSLRKRDDSAHTEFSVLSDRIDRLLPNLQQILPSHEYSKRDFSENRDYYVSTEFNDVPFSPQLNKYHPRQNIFNLQKREDISHTSSSALSEKEERLLPKLAYKLQQMMPLHKYSKKDSSKNEIPFVTTELNDVTFSPQLNRVSLKHLSRCDTFIKENMTCWFDRQIGDTITFSIHIDGARPEFWKEGILNLQWERRYHIQSGEKYIAEKLYPGIAYNNSWNIMIGSGGLRLRISPLKDIDMDFNSFTVSANAINRYASQTSAKVLSEITFKVNVIPIDMGYVYFGEEIVIDINNYITLPVDAHIFDWRLEKNYLTSLPPNMRVVNRGNILFITELSKEQEGVIVCAIYSKTHLFLAKRRFLIRSPVLKYFSDQSAKKS